jgi:hypothetical protein
MPDHQRDRGEREPGRGEVLRPEPVVLGQEAVVPDANLVPVPDRFTHELTSDEPYRLDRRWETAEPDGVLVAGTPVAVLAEGRETSRVATASGLAVDVRTDALRRLPDTWGARAPICSGAPARPACA